MTILKFDKLKSSYSEDVGSPEFLFNCVECKSKQIYATPFGSTDFPISYKPTGLNNEDIKNLDFRAYFNKLPDLKQALEKSIHYGNIRFECKDCNFCFAIPKNHNRDKLRDFINKQAY